MSKVLCVVYWANGDFYTPRLSEAAVKEAKVAGKEHGFLIYHHWKLSQDAVVRKVDKLCGSGKVTSRKWMVEGEEWARLEAME